MIWFRLLSNGRYIPCYFRKSYKKARYKRASERMAPGFWKMYVAGGVDNELL